MERETGIEPATSSLGSWHSTTELLPLRAGKHFSRLLHRVARTSAAGLCQFQKLRTAAALDAGDSWIISVSMGSSDRGSSNSEVFDLPSLWARVGGDVELLREMVAIFTVEAPPILAQLEAAIESNDPARVERASHKLRGSLAQFSAHAAAETAGHLEDMGKNSSLQGADVVCQSLRREVAELLQAMNLVVSQRISE